MERSKILERMTNLLPERRGVFKVGTARRRVAEIVLTRWEQGLRNDDLIATCREDFSKEWTSGIALILLQIALPILIRWLIENYFLFSSGDQMKYDIHALLEKCCDECKGGKDCTATLTAALPFEESNPVIAWLVKIVQAIVDNGDEIIALAKRVSDFLTWINLFACSATEETGEDPGWPIELEACEDEGYALRRELAVLNME